MNLDYIVNKLKAKGVHIKAVHRSDYPDLVDHEITLSKTIYIQVSSYGDSYMNVVRMSGDDFIFYPERLEIEFICLDIRKAMVEEEVGL